MKFLLIPAYDRPYDLRMMRGLGDALAEAGHDCTIVPFPKCDGVMAKEYDILLVINRPRPDNLAKNVKYIVWIQDFYPPGFATPDGTPCTYEDCARPDDIFYTLGDAGRLGIEGVRVEHCKSLLTGIDPGLLDYSAATTDLDFSICGYIPLPMTKLAMNPVERFYFQEAERLYTPLTGSIHHLEFASALFATEDRTGSIEVPEAQRQQAAGFCKWLASEYPRYADRLRLAQLAYFVSTNCEFHGINWRKYSQFGPHTFAPTKDENELYGIFRRSKINLNCNCSGFGLHSRVLESMAVGGFIMSNACPDPQADGRLTTCFEPDVHFGEYTQDNFIEKARYWLQNDEARNRAINESRKIIASQHLWKHRAQQILNDLK